MRALLFTHMLLVIPPAHSKAGARKMARNWDGLTHQIDENLSELASILSDGELQHLDKQTRITEWSETRFMQQNKNSGLWEEKPPEPALRDLGRKPGPTLLDVRNLPLPLRPRAFHSGHFDVSPKA